jgi:hypothetical protein
MSSQWSPHIGSVVAIVLQPVGGARCSGSLQKCLCPGRTIAPDASRRIPRPRGARAPQVRPAQHTSGAMYNFSSALSDRRVRQRGRAQAYSTTCRSGIAAARRHIGLDLINDLGQLGTAVRAYIFSSTLHRHRYRWLLLPGRLEKHNHGRCRATSLRGGVGVRHPSGRRVADCLFPRVGRCAAAATARTRRPKRPKVGCRPRTHSTLLASQVPPRRSRRAAPVRARWPTSTASPRPSSPPPPTSPPPVAVDFAR